MRRFKATRGKRGNAAHVAAEAAAAAAKVKPRAPNSSKMHKFPMAGRTCECGEVTVGPARWGDTKIPKGAGFSGRRTESIIEGALIVEVLSYHEVIDPRTV